MLNFFYNDFKIIKESVYDKCGFELSNLKQHSESKEYGACSFVLNGHKIQYRVAKITPTKIGQFVTIWKRNKSGITEPFNVTDDLDFIIITVRSADNLGQFIFPKLILAKHGIITQNGKSGKRGIRVYPPWDIVESKQAQKTQDWQINYFFSMNTDINFKGIKELMVNSNI